MSNRDEILNLLGSLLLVVPDERITEGALNIYVTALEDIEYHVLNEAIWLLIRTYKFPSFPKIGDIREKAVSIILMRNGVRSPEMAWEEVVANMREVGRDGIPYWTNGHIHRAVKSMGWYDICMSENIGITRSAFIKLYSEILDELRQNLIIHAVLPELEEGSIGRDKKALAVRFNQDGTPQTSQDMGLTEG
jgi:hypothetical protein